jgi:hypothetical protein
MKSKFIQNPKNLIILKREFSHINFIIGAQFHNRIITFKKSQPGQQNP